MEDRDGPLAEEVADPPFSDLMTRWLDEGDQLSESVGSSATAATAGRQAPLRQALASLRAGVERYRLFVLAGVGLLPLALFTATHQGAAGATVVASTVSSALPATGPAPTLPPAVHQPALAASQSTVAAHETAAAAPAPPAVVHRKAVAAPHPPPRRPIRQQHRHQSVARRSR